MEKQFVRWKMFVNLLDGRPVRYGMLTVREFRGFNKHHRSQWLCQCDCGSAIVVLGNSLTTRHTQSCPCRRRAATITRNRAGAGVKRGP